MLKSSCKHLFRILYCTLFIILPALTLIPHSLTYAADVTLEWSANNESDLAGYYIYYKTGSSGSPYDGSEADEGASPIKISLLDLVDPSNPSYTIHGLSDTATTFIVLTAFDIDDNESGYSNEVTYQPPSAPTLSSLTITGEDLVNENSSAGFTATAIFSDGSTQAVTNSATWSEDSLVAGINSSGIFTALEVSVDTTVTIQASYLVGETTLTATKVVTIVDTPVLNLPPDSPMITYPENGQYDVENPPEIITEPFSDPNDDAHSQSQWQISEKGDFSTTIIDITSTDDLTTLPVPHMVLKENLKYYVRVRFYDIYSQVSDWSTPVEFTTALIDEDLNSNGIADIYEVDDTVDFNLDGIPDIDQPETIKCVQTEDGAAYIGIEKISDSIDEIETVGVIDPETITDTANRPSDLIFGLVSYRLRVNPPGATAILKIYFSGEVFASDIFYKYDTINGWHDYSDHTTFNDDGQSITMELKDGGYGDSDGQANGIIVDPGGITSGSVSTDSVSDTSGLEGLWGGCFIATAAFGSKFEKHVQLLRRFRDLYLMPHRMGRAFVSAYYRYSPPLADFIGNHDTLRTMVRWSLVPLIGLSWMLLHFGLAPTLLLLGLMFTGMLTLTLQKNKPL